MRTPKIPTLVLALSAACVISATPSAAQTAGPEVSGQVRALAANPAVQEAFRRVEALDAWGVERLVELTQIPAPQFGEGPRAARYAQLLKEAGADSVWTDEVGNVLALRKGRRGDRTVVLGGHLDTVFPEGTDVTVRMVGDTLFAPGIGDDTRGLVVVLVTLRAMEEAGVETDDDILFVGTVGEEGLGDLRGIKHIFREGADPVDAWIEVDGGGLGGIVSMGLGSYRFRVTFKGPGGHSWGAFGLVNPAHALGRGIHHFQDAADTLTRSGPRTSYNMGVIGGGTSINSIPFEAWAEVDMRSEGGAASLDRVEAALRSAMQRAAEEENALRRRGEPLTVEVAKIGMRPSGEMDPQAPLVLRAIAANEFFGADGDLSRSSTNSNIPIALGVPAVTIGRGGVGGENHSPTEWWINRDGHLAIQRALLLVVAEAKLAALVP
ncbi:MAG TPA: M20/M25/M40 family metallo-hydrolase [Longimicrobiales bacterium]|nr:M20/M25/M40 family metallo-hydrolase [Longimicrobiales bacterium]